jgi:hypothetical protein
MVGVPMFDEVNYYTSILKIGHLARYQRSLPWDIAQDEPHLATIAKRFSAVAL